MLATLCLFTCALATAQPSERGEWLLTPRLNRGQELVYRGAFAEEAVGTGVQFHRTYRLESRVFVLESSTRGLDVALFTVLKLRGAPAGQGQDSEPVSVRLEFARLDPQGRLTGAPGVSLAIPLEGPATVERGAFVEFPRAAVSSQNNWSVGEPGRPPQAWRVLGTEAVNGTTCVKLEGVQQSEDWDRPRADRTAWRRRDFVWIASRMGVAYRVERTIERREPAREEPTQRSVARFELESSLQYPGQLFEERRREILQARSFAEAAAPYLPQPAKYGPRPFEAILAKINHYIEDQPPTPYRAAIQLVKRRVEAGRRGETPPALPTEDPAAPILAATLGQLAPDFVVTNLLTRESARLRRLQGQPILMVFYSPTSTTVNEVLRFAQAVASAPGRTVTVLGLAVSDDVERIRKQCDDLHITFPILSGKGLRQTYAVDATPKLIVLDANGIVRGNYVGWGRETPYAVDAELKRCQNTAVEPTRRDGTSRP